MEGVENRIKEENVSLLERLATSRYYAETVKECLNKLDTENLYATYSKNMNERDEYKALINNTDFEIAKRYAERFWPSNNRNSSQTKEIIKDLFEIIISKKITIEPETPPATEQDMQFLENYLKFSQSEIESIKSQAIKEELHELYKTKFPPLINNTPIEVIEDIYELMMSKKTCIGIILGRGNLPKDYLQNIFLNINHLTQDHSKIINEDSFPNNYEDKLRQMQSVYYSFADKDVLKAEFYTHVEEVLKDIGNCLKEKDELGAEKYIRTLELLSISEDKLINKSSKNFRPINILIDHKLRHIVKEEHINNVRLDEFYLTGISDYDLREYFNDTEVSILEQIRTDAKSIRNINRIFQEGEEYKNQIQKELNRIEQAKKDISAKKASSDSEKYQQIKTDAMSNLTEIINKYEKRDQIAIKNRFYNNLRDIVPGEYIDGSLWNNEFESVKGLVFADHSTHLKVLHYVKKEIADKTKDKEILYKIQELEKMVADKVEKPRRTLDQIQFSPGGNELKNGIWSPIDQELLLFKTLKKYTQEKYVKLSEHKPLDCLTANGKYELQGLTLLNNSQSTTLEVQREEYEYGKEKLGPFDTIGRAFLYDAKVENERGLFVAGFSGYEEFDNFSSWYDTTVNAILKFAKKNKYKKVFFNINPIGDVRNYNTKYSHEFAKAVANICGIPETEYTYTKLGSGRKPKFFELTQESKEKYTKHIQVTRDEDLIGTFFVEGMFETREEAVNSQISLNPEKENFTPYFFEKEGYAPVIEYKI